MRRRIPQINAEVIDFDGLARQTDQAIIARYDLLAELSKKPPFDQRIRFNACQVVREPERLTVRFLDSKPGAEPKIVAQCCFLPAPAGARPRPL